MKPWRSLVNTVELLNRQGPGHDGLSGGCEAIENPWGYDRKAAQQTRTSQNCRRLDIMAFVAPEKPLRSLGGQTMTLLHCKHETSQPATMRTRISTSSRLQSITTTPHQAHTGSSKEWRSTHEPLPSFCITHRGAARNGGALTSPYHPFVITHHRAARNGGARMSPYHPFVSHTTEQQGMAKHA
jgi:hypothetical protein